MNTDLKKYPLIWGRVLGLAVVFPPFGFYLSHKMRKTDPERAGRLLRLVIVSTIVEVMIVGMAWFMFWRVGPKPQTRESTPLSTTGTWGTCNWHVDGDVLVIEAGTGEDNKGQHGKGSSPWTYLKQKITAARLEDGVVFPAKCANLFAGLSHMRTIDMGRVDTSHVLDMTEMFCECESITSLDMSRWSTSQVTSMARMFSGCKELEALDTAALDTSAVTAMGSMFSDCQKFRNVDVSRWDMSKVQDVSYMFRGCAALESLDMSKWNTSQLKDANNMLDGCLALRSVDLSGWDASNLSSREVFGHCPGLESFAVGEGFSFDSEYSVPESTSKEKPGMWFSKADRVWYGRKKVRERNGVVDTYTNSEG